MGAKIRLGKKGVAMTDQEKQRMEKLEAFAKRYAYCPGCEGVKECLPGCTNTKALKEVRDYTTLEIFEAAREALQ